ncbi:hypothetical protein AADV58_18390 (plasmid) [Azonexus hydrophilus]|uniref:Helix-turn-helix domain-containing protein n=1 Tax=Azonexus hydrophilus TaxID=418702 RepID=A0ABZ2XME5_9RHOO
MYLTSEELAERIRYDVRSVRTHLAKSMIEGVHYVRGPGGRKKLWVWNQIEKDMLNGVFSARSSSGSTLDDDE